MAAEMTRKELFEACQRIDLYVDYYAPGDGVNRYRFWNQGVGNRPPASLCYFSCRSIYTALGLSEACTFALGYRYGRAQQRKANHATTG